MVFDANGRKLCKQQQSAGFHQQKGDYELVIAHLEGPTSVHPPSRYAAPRTRPDREAEMTLAYNTFRARLS